MTYLGVPPDLDGVLPPADCSFVDDTEAGVVTARPLGMGAAHFGGAAARLAEFARLTGRALCPTPCWSANG